MKKGRVRNAPRLLDLFCGIGGLTLGLHRAGFESIGGVDIWSDAAVTFEQNLGLNCMLANLTEVGADEICDYFGTSSDQIDVLVGGPPCQGFSTVGKRDLADPRNNLWSCYLKLVNEIRPAYVVIENVEGLAVMEKGGVCNKISESFSHIGYNMRWQLLTSADFGVPQLRKRVIFFGWLDGLQAPSFPRRPYKAQVTVKDAIFDLPQLEPGQCKTRYEDKPFTEYQKDRRRNTKTLSHHEAVRHSSNLVEILKHIPDGGNRKSIPDELQPKSGFHNSYARLASNKPAIAVTSNMRKPSSARTTHPTQHRGLTLREGLRLQTFDDDFIVSGSRSSQYLQVGNAVPPLLGEVIGAQIMTAFSENTPTQLHQARTSPPKSVATPSDGQLRFQFEDSQYTNESCPSSRD